MKETIQAILSKYQFYLWPVGALFLSAILIGLVIIPQISRYMRIQGEIQLRKDRITNLSQKAQKLEAVDEKSTKEDLEVALLMLPSERDVLSVLASVQTLAETNNLRIEDLAYSTGTADAGKKDESYALKLSINGEMDNLETFIEKIKTTPKIIRLDMLSLSGNRISTVYTSETTLRSYFQPLPKIVGAVDAPLQETTIKDKELLAKLRQIQNDFPKPSEAPVASSSAIGKEDPFN